LPSTATNGAGPSLRHPPEHPFLRRLWVALLPELERELLDTCRVGVLLGEGISHDQARRRLGLERRDFAAALARLERAAGRL
jgi:hypothetical protein